LGAFAIYIMQAGILSNLKVQNFFPQIRESRLNYYNNNT